LKPVETNLNPILNGLKMQFLNKQNPLIIILGPTAVGKTELSLQLAERFNGEVVSADSRLFYRGMDIGTAKPSSTEQARVPHHLVDVADPDEIWSLARFQEEADRIIHEIYARERIPFLVGGTGQYIRAVSEGWQPPSQPADTRLREAIEHWGQEIGPLELYHRLETLDAEAAANIQYQNMRRTVRALEVIFQTGRKFSQQRRKGAARYSLLQLGFIRPRAELYARIDARIDQMISSGFVEEVKMLLDKGYDPALPNLSAIGYREMIAYLQGKMSFDEAVMLMKRQTRQFVRRQANWFKPTDENIHWFDLSQCGVEEIEEFIRSGEGWMETN
jgi:tRNA dimethylallyltransferase